MEKSYRIHTNISNDTLLNVNMKQDFDFLEILSLKLRQKDAYRLHSSNYGVIVGRVLANDAFGVPNAKVSMFIERDASDSSALRNIYPYSDVNSKDSNARRYNILPDYSDDSCYRVVGTFPRKRYLLDDDVQLEVYDKYWKYTTVTNQAGDYMLFGVPEGGQQLHVDIDLSDIGILSQRPRDFVFKGHNVDEFDSPSQFKESTNLESLQQIISQNKTTVVYPFWGDPENGIAAITRCDIEVNYKFEPTCVFMGSIVSDNDGNSIGHKCAPDEDSGLNSQLIAGEGTIEMIRKTQDGLVEEFPIKGNALIDADGVWCYQIPMNLDYVGTDEYGNIVPTDNPSKGIPTRTQVRFRFSKRETGDEGFSRHTAKYLVPMNPIMREDSFAKNTVPTTQAETGLEMERMYNFGSNTPQSCFRDLYWNNVYSVKNFIPKVQVAHRPYSTNYGALKGSNLVDNQNPIPFNKLRVDMPFSYMIVCILFTVVMIIITVINGIIWALQELRSICLDLGWFELCPFFFIPPMGCIPLNAGLGDGSNTAFYPGCDCPDSEACKNSSCPDGMEDGCTKDSNNHLLKDRIQQALALDYKIVKLDFYQDWLNGCLYMPLWYWRKRTKKKFLFFTISGAKNEFCDCDKEYSRLKTYVTCDIVYRDTSMTTDEATTDEGENRWHKKKREWVRYKNGLIKGVENKDGLTAYYYVAYQPTDDDPIDLPIEKRTKPFKFARLYATDIILLGNLNEDNIYGIPQFFKALPSTTANIPPIATIEESAEDSISDNNDTVTDGIEESGTTITTGMDWGYYGKDQTPKFKTGLFIDLACTYAGTKAKSCINVERLSELGVNLDMTYSKSYAHNSSGIKTGMIDSDGFISKLELDDLDNRATFATLNHIGFVPQDYQDSIGGYTTQVPDENTGYLVPKFKYIYPVDFDGRLQPIMDRYKDGFEQALYDEQDESYLTFRLGAENKNDKTQNLEGRIRHFYHDDDDGQKGVYNMPLYNNSFYFYFGINKGNTAIDKFNKLFFSPCFQRAKAPFSSFIDSMGKSYCVETYKEKGDNAYNGNAYIRFTSDDIITPFSYILYDSFSNVVESGDNMTVTDFVIGGTLEKDDEGKTIVKTPENDLTNQVYVLVITDGNGRKISERIELKTQRISLDYSVEPLKSKFYSTGSTRMDYICNDRDKYYGKVKIKSFSIDGARYYVTTATVMSYDSEIDAYKIRLTGVNADDFNESTGYKVTGNTAYALLKVSAMESPNVGWVRDCMCDTGNTVYSVNGQDSNIGGTDENMYWFANVDPGDDDEKLITGKTGDEEVAINKIPTMFVYQPNRFNLTITQLCEVEEGVFKEIEENTSSEIAAVANGVNFNTFLNKMPIKFMIGTTTDSKDATVANNSKFYSSKEVTDPNDSHISGWYGLHQEDSYMWGMSENQVLKRNEEMWSDFVDVGIDITRHGVKGNILAYKFNTMFSLSNAAYVVNNIERLHYEAQGGVPPTLYRSAAPKYSSLQAMRSIYRLNDGNSVTGQKLYPNIVGSNYSFIDESNEIIHHKNQGANFNLYYTHGAGGKGEKYVGNYFAAFTNNGGYISNDRVDPDASVARIPTNAKVTPIEGDFVKRLGRDIESDISYFSPVYKSVDGFQPYIRAMYVDRRFDFDITLFGPCMPTSSVNLYPVIPDNEGKTKQDPREKIWKSARISGITYNGIEMSYDRDYNVISANVETNDDKVPTAATPNNRLEYTYNYSDVDEDAKTVYNMEKNMIWDEDAYGVQKTEKGRPVYDKDGNPVYVEGKEPKNGQIVKRFHDATFVGIDIRNFFWSDFNQYRLNQYVTQSDYSIKNNAPYVFKYPNTTGSLYNGDFNRLNVTAAKNYPTKRFIDVCNIMPSGTYDLFIQNCSYNISAHYMQDGSITGKTNDSDGMYISTSFDRPVRFIPPNSESEDYANIRYQNIVSDKEGYAKFKAKSISLLFSINPAFNDNFNVYTAVPKVIKVLPLKNGYDGISYIKTVTPTGEVAARGDVISAIDEIAIHTFTKLSSNVFNTIFGSFDTIVPEGVSLDNMQMRSGGKSDSMFYRNDEKFLSNSDPDFQSIKYVLNETDTMSAKMFTICIERQYISIEDLNLIRNIRTFEFSDIYDARPLYIQVKTDAGSTSTEGPEWTYVEKRKITEGKAPTPGAEGDDISSLVQVITFELFFPTVLNPEDGCCEAFADTKSMSYTLNMKDANENTYSVPAIENTAEEVTEGDNKGTKIMIKFRWTQDMGTLGDENVWGDGSQCSIVAKTGSNFIYKIDWFTLTGVSQDCSVDDMEEGERCANYAKI